MKRERGEGGAKSNVIRDARGRWREWRREGSDDRGEGKEKRRFGVGLRRKRREKTGKLVDRSTSGWLPLNGNAEGIIAVSRSS